MADGEKGFEKGFLGKRRIQTIETLTKEKATPFSHGRAKEWLQLGLERRGRALSVQVVRVSIPFVYLIYNTKGVNPSQNQHFTC